MLLGLIACNASTDHSQLQGPKNAGLSCLPAPTQVTIDGEIYRVGKRLGSGSYGIVYQLEHANNDQTRNYVLKIIKTRSEQEALEEGNMEVLLARLLNSNQIVKLAADTHLNRIFSFTFLDRNYHVPLLIKERVLGYTAYDLIRNHSLINQLGTTYKAAYESFLVFEGQLIENLAKHAAENRFIVDLHHQNIMFDGEKWLIVDGFVLTKRSELVEYIESSYSKLIDTNIRLRLMLNTLKSSDDEGISSLPLATKKNLFQILFETETGNLKATLEQQASVRKVSL